MNKNFLFLISLSGVITVSAQKTEEFVTVQASNQYSHPSFFKRLILGSNYRKEWETAVKLPVFQLNKLGLVIKELGGGMQTKSLQMEDAKGKEWVLRTVEKEVTPNLPKPLQGTFVEDVLQDMISAAHPYAPLTIPALASAIGIVVPSPTFYYVPDDPALGEHRALFAHTVCMLEEREPTLDNSDTHNTLDALEKLVEKNSNRIMQKQVLKARLLDMLIADWDRHADQWRWGVKDSSGAKYFYAIPRDRDQAYFHSNGLLVKIARQFVLKHFVGFRDNLSKIKQLNFKSWNFDKTFINDLTKDEWKEVISEVQNSLTDNVIDNAVKKLPAEIYPLNGPLIANKLKNRRNELMQAGLKYYDYITHTITVNGTDEKELFNVKGSGENLQVQVFTKAGAKIFDRLVLPHETKVLELVGLGSNDEFIIEPSANSSIKLHLHGGTGEDIYDLQGKTKSSITDFKSEQNHIKKRGGAKITLE